jgi:hypothetical protein
MNLGHAVRAVSPHHGKVCHADLARRRFLDQAHTLPPAVVARVAKIDVIEKSSVDFVDDLEMSGHQQLEQFDRPLFERLRQKRVVGVGQRPNGQVPGLVPAEMALVEQDPHQLGDGERRVRVVELNRHMIRQRRPRHVAFLEASEDVLQRAADQKVFLQEPQRPAGFGGIVRVEDTRDRLGGDIGDHRAREVAV